MVVPKEPKPLPSTKDLQAEYDKLKLALDTAKQNLIGALTVTARNSAQVRLENAQKAFDVIETKYKAAKKREDITKESAAEGAAEREALKAKGVETIRVRQERVDNARTAYQKQPNKQNLFDTYQRELGVLNAAFDDYAAKGFNFPRTVEPFAGGGFKELTIGTGAATSGAAISPSTVDTAERASQKATEARVAADETLTVKSTREVVKNGVTVIQTTYVDGSVTEKAKVVSTAAAPKVPKVVKGVTTTVAPSTDWEATFRSKFPAKAWLLDQDRTKYPQLFALIQKAYNEKYYASPEGRERFAAELAGVDFYNELAASGKVREIKNIVGELGFDSTDFSKFVTDSINFGWTGDTLKSEAYKEAFRKNPDGTYANPTSVKRATVGNDYLGVQLIAKNYFNSAPQSSIESVLTGTITTQDFQRQQREIAKKRYGHLADLIDQGVTLEDLAGNYKQTAAKLLEVDPNTIDMSQGDYEIALSFGEEGKKRAMTTGEWEKLLRTDARYGWEKTENAKTEARSLASNLAQAFGRII